MAAAVLKALWIVCQYQDTATEERFVNSTMDCLFDLVRHKLVEDIANSEERLKEWEELEMACWGTGDNSAQLRLRQVSRNLPSIDFGAHYLLLYCTPVPLPSESC